MRYEAAYARQSVEKKSSLSIKGQLDLCTRTSGNSSLLMYSDQGYSGKNTDRPDFQRLLKDIKADKISKLYVYRLDRFSRSIADFGQLWNVLQAHSVEFVSVTESFDTSTPMGRAMLHIIMVFAQLERETTAERVKDNYDSRAALGSWPGGPAPYGYCNGRTSTGSPTLVPNMEQLEIVCRIFEEYAEEGATLKSVADMLNREKIPCVRRSTWDNVSVARVLHAPVYVNADTQVRLYYASLGVKVVSEESAFDGEHGLLLYGKRKANDRKYTDVKDHHLAVLNSPGVVSSELFLCCQDKLSRNAQIGNAGKGTHSWLSGMMKCAKCGYSITVQKRKNGLRRMICSGRYNLSQCDADIRTDLTELENAVAMEIERLLAECPPSEPVEPIRKDIYAEKLDALDRKADRLLEAFANDESLNGAYLQRALARLEKERKDILASRKREKSRPAMPEKLVFSDLSFEEKKIVAAQFIERIEVSENSAEIKWAV
jgi:site-specific DNA recombinase